MISAAIPFATTNYDQVPGLWFSLSKAASEINSKSSTIPLLRNPVDMSKLAHMAEQQQNSCNAKVERLLSVLTLDEKCNLLSGKNMWETADISRLGVRSLKTTDGPAGVRGARWTGGTHTTYIPCGISLAATFDPPLVRRLGHILGREAVSKEAHVLLAPTMNISRSPLGERNFENLDEDPSLTGVMAASRAPAGSAPA